MVKAIKGDQTFISQLVEHHREWCLIRDWKSLVLSHGRDKVIHGK